MRSDARKRAMTAPGADDDRTPHTHGGTDAPECTPYGTRCAPPAADDGAVRLSEEERADLRRAMPHDVNHKRVDSQRIEAVVERILAARRPAAEDGLRAALSDAIDELVECRSFISVETRHYPTVTAISTEIERLRAVLARHPADQTGDR